MPLQALSAAPGCRIIVPAEDMNKKILVIDDEESIRFTFSCLLADQGYDVASVASHAAGLQALQSDSYDLIFLDLLLGVHSGLTTLQEIKSRHPEIPIIMITGAPDEETVTRAISMGAFAYVPKPVRQETLANITRKALSLGAPTAVRQFQPDASFDG